MESRALSVSPSLVVSFPSFSCLSFACFFFVYDLRRTHALVFAHVLKFGLMGLSFARVLGGRGRGRGGRGGSSGRGGFASGFAQAAPSEPVPASSLSFAASASPFGSFGGSNNDIPPQLFESSAPAPSFSFSNPNSLSLGNPPPPAVLNSFNAFEARSSNNNNNSSFGGLGLGGGVFNSNSNPPSLSPFGAPPPQSAFGDFAFSQQAQPARAAKIPSRRNAISPSNSNNNNDEENNETNENEDVSDGEDDNAIDDLLSSSSSTSSLSSAVSKYNKYAVRWNDGKWHKVTVIRHKMTLQLFFDGRRVGCMHDKLGVFQLQSNNTQFYLGRDARLAFSFVVVDFFFVRGLRERVKVNERGGARKDGLSVRSGYCLRLVACCFFLSPLPSLVFLPPSFSPDSSV